MRNETRVESDAASAIRHVVAENRSSRSLGVYSVCSAHPWVLEAALAQSMEDGSLALVEATSNQVNQFGGYTGKTPARFAAGLRELARKSGFPRERLLLGGDHLGPYPWRKQPAAEAMGNACSMVREYVLAGFVKIHLDASMPCADDPAGALDPEVAASRAAEMCSAAEEASQELPGGNPPPLYVVGTEVPVPGGEQSGSGAPAVTKVEDAAATLATHQTAFARRNLEVAFDRIIGLVVDPGVEFGSAEIFDYDRGQAGQLSRNLPARPELVYEAHSTDYQSPRALRELVEDHYAILKVGPWLTFAMREAVFALSALEEEWLGRRRGIELARVPRALDEAMLRNPDHWSPYYDGDEAARSLARKYSYSDRCRYYWPTETVKSALDTLVRNLRHRPPPLTLLSHFLPTQYDRIREGNLTADPVSLIHDRVRQVLHHYSAACGNSR